MTEPNDQQPDQQQQQNAPQPPASAGFPDGKPQQQQAPAFDWFSAAQKKK